MHMWNNMQQSFMLNFHTFFSLLFYIAAVRLRHTFQELFSWKSNKKRVVIFYGFVSSFATPAAQILNKNPAELLTSRNVAQNQASWKWR